MMQKIFFRADGNSSIGLGHVLRLVALADMLKNHFTICFAIQGATDYIKNLLTTICNEIITLPLEKDLLKEAQFISENYLTGNEIVVLDGYHFHREYQTTIKSNCKKLVYIDDLRAGHQAADVIINHAENVIESDYDAEPKTQFYLGLKYALVRKDFFQNQNSQKSISEIKKIFVSMGGADVSNVTLKVVEALEPVKKIESITILIAHMNPNHQLVEKLIKEKALANFKVKCNLSAHQLCEEFRSSQLFICPASTTAIEAIAFGIGLLSGYTAENQLGILSGLTEKKCLINLGDLVKIPAYKIREEVLNLMEKTNSINEMIFAQKKLIDGKSPERLLQIFKELAYA